MTSQYALLISPVSQLPTVTSTKSHSYPELIQSGYQVIQYGNKRELTEIEQEMMADFVNQFD